MRSSVARSASYCFGNIKCSPRCSRGSSIANPNDAARGPRPRKKRQDRSRSSGLVPEVEVIGSRVVEIHRELHESQSEDRGVEIEIALRIPSDGRDVMNPENRVWLHDTILLQVVIVAEALAG